VASGNEQAKNSCINWLIMKLIHNLWTSRLCGHKLCNQPHSNHFDC